MTPPPAASETSAATGRRRIRVLLVDDSLLALEIIRRMLAAEPRIELCGTARDGAEALDLIPRLRPDVVCTDLHMPVMGGQELIREVVARHPLPILVLSVAVQKDQSAAIFEMLEAGALDIVAKPRGGLCEHDEALARELIAKIKVAAGVIVLRRRRRPAMPPPVAAFASAAARLPVPEIIGIGASTGGPQALEAILRQLPAGFPLPLLCIQHIAEGFMAGLVDWLAHSSRVPVRFARDGEVPCGGTAYFAPEGRHLEIDNSGRLRCREHVSGEQHRPSVDLTLAALARRCGSAAMGVLLTGMGRDGAQGLGAIARAGGLTIAQDAASSIVFGMPRAAIEAGAAHLVLPLDRIAPALIRIACGEHPAVMPAATSPLPGEGK